MDRTQAGKAPRKKPGTARKTTARKSKDDAASDGNSCNSPFLFILTNIIIVLDRAPKKRAKPRKPTALFEKPFRRPPAPEGRAHRRARPGSRLKYKLLLDYYLF